MEIVVYFTPFICILFILLGMIAGRLKNIWLELIEIKKLTKANNDY